MRFQATLIAIVMRAEKISRHCYLIYFTHAHASPFYDFALMAVRLLVLFIYYTLTWQRQGEQARIACFS